MRRSTDQDALTHLSRRRENRRVNQIFLSRLVEENIFAAARFNRKAVVTGQTADVVGMDAGRIDDVLRFNRAFIRFNGLYGTVFYDDVRNLTVTDDFGTVDDGIFRKGQRQAEGPADAGCRSKEGRFYVFADIRFFFAHFIAADNFQTGNAVCLSTGQEFFEDIHLFVVESCYI